MRKSGRQKEAIWGEFIEIPTAIITSKRVKCKTWGLEMQGLVQRLKDHKATKCQGSSPIQDESHETDGKIKYFV